MAPAGNKRARPLPNDDGVLPTDLLCEVLLRVPADGLCRLRLVCRSWRSLTSEPRFAAAHASRHPLVAGLHNRSGEVRIMDLSGGVVKRIPVRECGSGLSLSCKLGMACISPSSSAHHHPCEKGARARVLDTATGASTVLPGGDHESAAGRGGIERFFTLGHVPSTGEFKVLRVHWHLGRRSIGRNYYNEVFRSWYHTCDVTTLRGTDGDDGVKWRAKPYPPFNVWLAGPGCSTVVDGIAYFLMNMELFKDPNDTSKPDDIASFDLAAEEWRPATIQGPLSMHLASAAEDENNLYSQYTNKVRLAELHGCLVTVLHNDQDRSMDLWFLVDADGCGWTKRYSMCTPRLLAPRGFWRPHPFMVLNDERVIVVDDYSLKAYDIRAATWECLASIESCSCVRRHEGNLLQSRSSELVPAQPYRLDYQPPVNNTFISETNQQLHSVTS